MSCPIESIEDVVICACSECGVRLLGDTMRRVRRKHLERICLAAWGSVPTFVAGTHGGRPVCIDCRLDLLRAAKSPRKRRALGEQRIR